MQRKILTIIAVGSILCMALTGCVKFSYGNPAKADTTTEDEEDDDSTVKVTKKDAEKIKKLQEALGMAKEAAEEEETGEETKETTKETTKAKTKEKTPFNVSAALGSQKGGLASLGIKYTIYENGAEITAFENENGVIQEEVEYEGAKYPVISLNIRDGEFIKTLEIPSHIKYIREIGVYGRFYLESLVIPATVEYISGDGTFCPCENLKNITFLGEFETDSKWAGTFANCYNLQSAIAVPEGVTELEDTFRDCRSLVSVSLPNGLKTIGDETFENCESLTEITIPDSVTEISQYAFAGAGIKRIDIPESVTKIGLNAFTGCNELEELYFPDSVTDLGGMSEMENLKKVRWSNNAKFYSIRAPKLELMIFPDNTEDLPADMFNNVEDKSKLTIQVPAKTVEYFRTIFPEINVVAKE